MRETVIAIIPQLASFQQQLFCTDYLADCTEHIIQTVQSGGPNLRCFAPSFAPATAPRKVKQSSSLTVRQSVKQTSLMLSLSISMISVTETLALTGRQPLRHQTLMRLPPAVSDSPTVMPPLQPVRPAATPY